MTKVDCTFTNHANTAPKAMPIKMMYKMMIREEREHLAHEPVRMK
jgi:hypothetical protein